MMKYKIGFYDDYVKYTIDSNERILGYRCFYPAKAVNGKSEKYLDKDRYYIYKKLLEGSPFEAMYDKYLDLDTNIYKDAVIDDGSFDVIVYSSGYNNVQWDNLFVIEELVRNGYVVFALTRAGESICTKLGDELVLRDIEKSKPFNDEIVKYFIEADEYDVNNPDPDFVYNWSLEGMIKYVRQCKIAGKQADFWSADISEMINLSEKLDNERNHILYNKLNTKEFGAFGNSLGGSTSLNAALNDDRIKASINFDGWLFGGKLLDNKLSSDALVFGKSHKHYEAYCGTENKNIKSIVFKRAQNEFMSDMCIINEDEVKNMYGNIDIIDGNLMAQIKRDFVCAFFNIIIRKDNTVSLEGIAEKYKDEVTLI